jgi:transcriptional regulator with XRE-family HTH domain
LRRRLGLRQRDVAARAGCSQSQVSLIERGRVAGTSVRQLRTLFAVFDAEVTVQVRWRGGELDRLLDARHARLAEALTTRLQAVGWEIYPEVSYAVYGERGSIDLLGWHSSTKSLLVIELKTELASIEEALRRHDAKVRLAASVCRQRFGWTAGLTARLLVLPDQRTARRRVEQHAAVFSRVYPDRNVVVKRWLTAPNGPLSGLLFVPDTNQARGVRRIRG